jgi:hypothetical protein
MNTYFIDTPNLECYGETVVTFADSKYSEFLKVNPLIADLAYPVAYYDYSGNTNIRQTIKMVKEDPRNPNRFFWVEGTEATNL